MNKLNKYLKERGISGAQLARMAQVGEADISKFRSGRNKPYPKQAARIAAALNYPGDPMELFEEVTDE